MKKERVLFILTVLMILIFSSVALAAIPVEVTVGKETILTLKKPSKRASLANPDIAGMTIISPTEIVLNGKRSGISSLIVWDKEGAATFFDVIVYKGRIAELDRARADALENKIKSIAPDTEIKVEMAGDTLVLTGTGKNRQIIDKIEKISMFYATKGCAGISRSSSLPRSSDETKAEAKELAEGQGYVSVNVQQQSMQEATGGGEELIYSDDFGVESGDWYTGSDEKALVSYADGGYFIEVIPHQFRVWSRLELAPDAARGRIAMT